ncbi:MAG: DUF2849 domain-containing protein [Rhodospirillales bacterium]|nr:DUF2849 domain-containing protein [Rhodospirillales bacterium]
MTLHIITGNRLTDGVVVFLATDGGWTETLASSRVIENDDELAQMKALADAAAKAAIVVEPYPIDVTRDGGEIRPVRYRERIRAYGPSIHPDFAKQDAAGHFKGDEEDDDAPPVFLNGV